mmetsp:Transcript_6941/g.13882  ORF Transcript_6941/g.13882 Transcript_6941/m.13882 type:complete len:262 (-) Transcript_6941:13-798(-)
MHRADTPPASKAASSSLARKTYARCSQRPESALVATAIANFPSGNAAWWYSRSVSRRASTSAGTSCGQPTKSCPSDGWRLGPGSMRSHRIPLPSNERAKLIAMRVPRGSVRVPSVGASMPPPKKDMISRPPALKLTSPTATCVESKALGSALFGPKQEPFSHSPATRCHVRPSSEVATPTYPVAIGMTSAAKSTGLPLYHIIHPSLWRRTTHAPMVAPSNQPPSGGSVELPEAVCRAPAGEGRSNGRVEASTASTLAASIL